MSINIRNERLISFVRAAKRIPRRRQGRPVHRSTISRWHRSGIKAGKQRVHLEAVRLPSGMATSVEALQRFIDRLSDLQQIARDKGTSTERDQ